MNSARKPRTILRIVRPGMLASRMPGKRRANVLEPASTSSCKTTRSGHRSAREAAVDSKGGIACEYYNANAHAVKLMQRGKPVRIAPAPCRKGGRRTRGRKRQSSLLHL